MGVRQWSSTALWLAGRPRGVDHLHTLGFIIELVGGHGGKHLIGKSSTRGNTSKIEQLDASPSRELEPRPLVRCVDNEHPSTTVVEDVIDLPWREMPIDRGVEESCPMCRPKDDETLEGIPHQDGGSR